MKVSDVLHRKGSDVTTAASGTRVREALRLLAEQNIGALVVTDGSGILGIVSERDIVRALPERGADLLDATVGDLMTRDVHRASSATDVVDALRLMTEERVRHLPVVDDDRLVGIVSIGDIVKYRIDDLQSTTEHLASYISGG